MTIAEILKTTIDASPVQFLHECLLGAKSVNGPSSQGRRKGHAPYTRIEFATTHMTPNDALFWTYDKPTERKPQYVGLVVWVPYEAYEAATSDASAPTVAPMCDTEQIARRMFSAGIAVAMAYGDNAFHLQGEQYNRQFEHAYAKAKK